MQMRDPRLGAGAARPARDTTRHGIQALFNARQVDLLESMERNRQGGSDESLRRGELTQAVRKQLIGFRPAEDRRVHCTC
jgi:hypothetical protein